MDTNILKTPTTKLTRLPTPVPDPGAEGAEAEGSNPDDGKMVGGERVGEVGGAQPREVTVGDVEFAVPTSVVEPETSGVNTRRRSERLWARSRTSSVRSRSHPSSDSECGTDTGPSSKTGKARRDLNTQRRQAQRMQLDEEVEERVQEYLKTSVDHSIPTLELKEPRVILRQDLTHCGKIVKLIVRKSGNLKGTRQRALNSVVETITKYVNQPRATVLSRLEEETKALRDHSARLETAMSRMTDENASLRRRIEELEKALPDSSQPSWVRLNDPPWPMKPKAAQAELPVQGGFIGGQPQSTTSKGKGKAKGSRASQPAPPVLTPANDPSSVVVAGPPGVKAAKQVVAKKGTQGEKRAASARAPQNAKAPPKTKGRGKNKASSSPAEQTPHEPRPLPPAPESMDTAWTEVVRRKKKAKSGAGKPAASRQSTKRPEPKLRPPKSAAVVISLTPAAVEKGLTYAGVLTDAQRRVDLSGLQIDRLRPKYAATGAMLYEVPGAESEQKADSLAARLRECFGDSGDIVVSRPTKCSELRISGWTFAATSETVKAALCSTGGCAAEAVKVGEVRQDRSGMGAVWAKVPTKAAQKIKAGRLKIGWVVARGTVLEARPMRCYRCLETGHVRGSCDGSADRSELCYRCGKPGHKARQCGDKPNCALCAAAGKPAEHQIGGKKCAASSQKTRRRPRRRPAAAAEVPSQPQAASPPQPVVAEMEVEEIAHQ
ncbi:uncharacterized protein LOC115451705 [Manduca sexta]|uniref:uncharacterized protein LOC115451705 n=1 Tax=Manduca sexta TaxID=7130 RepID=UPI00188E091A|nr:uncharacterized protein LOC115451705 [Manduca sexta]